MKQESTKFVLQIRSFDKLQCRTGCFSMLLFLNLFRFEFWWKLMMHRCLSVVFQSCCSNALTCCCPTNRVQDTVSGLCPLRYIKTKQGRLRVLRNALLGKLQAYKTPCFIYRRVKLQGASSEGKSRCPGEFVSSSLEKESFYLFVHLYVCGFFRNDL